MLRSPVRDHPCPFWHHKTMKWLLTFSLLSSAGCDTLRAIVVERYPIDYQPDGLGGAQAALTASRYWPAEFPKIDGDDAQRKHVRVELVPVLSDLNKPTDLVFFPESTTQGFVLEKTGRLAAFDLASSTVRSIVDLDVLTKSEQGLLGIALHPEFADNGRFFLHASVKKSGKEWSEITGWVTDKDRMSARQNATVIAVEQPYANHNAGQISFGPDNLLYIGLGDGGWRNDPHDHGQNGQTLLGSVLRVDIDKPTADRGYGIPADNPWVGDSLVRDEAWAIGLRNPWKFSFAPDGRMVLADVGQNAFEEVNIVSVGDNLGWNIREASHCFPPKTSCSRGSLVDPIFEYPHAMGSSITGGFVHTSDAIPEIQGDYVFADFVSGRIWAIPVDGSPSGHPVQAKALGQWPFLPSTFGRDHAGRLYVADFGQGVLYRIDPT